METFHLGGPVNIRRRRNAAVGLVTLLVLGGCTGSAEPADQALERVTETVTDTATETVTETVTEVVTERPTGQLNNLRRRLRQRSQTISRLRERIRSLEDQAAAAPEPEAEPEPASGCHPSYQPCVPIASDVDCAGGSGDGPEYTGRVTVVGPDEYGLDSDGDGVGCES